MGTIDIYHNCGGEHKGDNNNKEAETYESMCYINCISRVLI